MRNAPRNIADGEFVALALSSVLATVVDIESTAYIQKNFDDAEEVNAWLYGEHPRRAHMYAINVPLGIVFAALSYRLRKNSTAGRQNIWRLPLLALAIGHAAAAGLSMWNFRSEEGRSLRAATK